MRKSRKRGEARSFHAGGGRGPSGIRIVYIAALTLLTGIHFAHTNFAQKKTFCSYSKEIHAFW